MPLDWREALGFPPVRSVYPERGAYMPTACEDQGNACGYVEELGVVGGTAVHNPRQSTEKPTMLANTGTVVTRKYCVLKIGHGGGHSFRTQ